MEQKTFDVRVEEDEHVWDAGEQRVIKTLRHIRYKGEVSAMTRDIAVILAHGKAKSKITDLDMVTFVCDPFRG